MSRVIEHKIQCSCFQWVRLQQKLRKKDFRFKAIYAVPNGGHRLPKVAAKLKAEGVQAGVWDVSIDVAHHSLPQIHGLRIEIKSPRGKLSSEQVRMQEVYRRNGFATVVCRSLDEFIATIEAYFNL